MIESSTPPTLTFPSTFSSSPGRNGDLASFEERVAAVRDYFASPRFDGIVRLYTARQVVEQQGSAPMDFPVAREAAEAFYTRLRQLFAARRQITTFGPYSPGQAVIIKRLGIEGIYLGGWATSAKGGMTEDPGADLASYPLNQVPDEAGAIVRALLVADKNQYFARLRMTPEQRAATPEIDYRPFIIADADTGHGGDAHVRNLIRRFVEVGVPGYHIEDQKPGVKKCGHQGGKVLVAEREQIQRLNAARFQLDVMGVPGILVARTDAEAANLHRWPRRRARSALHPGRHRPQRSELSHRASGHLEAVPRTRCHRGPGAPDVHRARRRVRAGGRLAGANGGDGDRTRAGPCLARARDPERRRHARQGHGAVPRGVAGRFRPDDVRGGGCGGARVPRSATASGSR